MPFFNYRAKDAKGDYVDGKIEAPNQDDVLNKLGSQGLYPISIKIIESQPPAEFSPEDKKRIYEEEKFRLETREKLTKESQADNTKLILGLIGSIILFVGVFAPIVKLPMVGDMNYFQNGKGDGTIIMIFAVISLILTLAKYYKGLWYTGLASLGTMIFTFVHFQMKMSETQSNMARELADNPFKGLSDMMLQSIQIQWGWAILLVGASLVIAAAAIKTK